MDDEQEQDQEGIEAAGSFPPPPPFYKKFTAKNLARLKEFQSRDVPAPTADTQDSSPGSPQLKAQDLPPDLQLLVPPAPPSDGKYRMFGATYDLNDTGGSLSEQGIEQLYPTRPTNGPSDASTGDWTTSRALSLQKIVKSIMLSYLELVGILSQDPSQYAKKIEDLGILFTNAHSIVNEWRPHQARQDLADMLKAQIEDAKAEIAAVQALEENLNQTLKRLREETATVLNEYPVAGQETLSTTEAGLKKKQMEAWQAIKDALEDD